MPGLFSPMNIRNTEIPNRIVMPPMATSEATEAGEVTETHLEHYGVRAASGVGTIIVEHTFVRFDGRASEGQLGVHDDSTMDGLSRLAKTIRDAGAVAILQITHCGGTGIGDGVDMRGAGSRPVPGRNYPAPRPFSKEELSAVAEDFVAAARRAIAVGFDGVEIHGAHAYLLNQFLSPLCNDRTDEYGGDLAGRGRFPLEVVRAVRAELGENALVYYRLGAEDSMPGGLTLEEGSAFAAQLVSEGVDLVDVSGGLGGSRPEGMKREGYFVDAGVSVRGAIAPKPVMVAGGVINACTADELVREDLIDFVGIGRALLSDPFWALKAKERVGDVR